MFCKDNGQRSLGASGNPESHQFSFGETQWEAQPPYLPFLKTDLAPTHVSSLVPDPLGRTNPTVAPTGPSAQGSWAGETLSLQVEQLPPNPEGP